ncbi:carbamoyltransferase C-terminal domain-containing protein [Castellaniella ginsengisoli]|uniref:Carbamoyltransferase C-terminal domain-containing protein n=1 Tax=Castellaniella ginsengisoli TaxID=546114 RepID=A0AB39CWT8_9BURK
MYTLGINAAFHDCSAALVRDGRVIAASEEERFTGIKHGKRPVPFTAWQLPFHAIDDCLRQAGIVLADVHHIAYSFDPSLLDQSAVTPEGGILLPLEPSRHGAAGPGHSPWDPLFLCYVVNAPRQLAAAAPLHLAGRFRGMGLSDIQERWVFLDHHLCHEASAYLASPFQSPAVLTMDGRGEGVTTSYGHFSAGKYTRLKQIEMPHSLGLLYEEVTRYLGFLHASDEYKVMALASYGQPEFRDVFRDILHLDGDGGFLLEPARLDERLGPPRGRGEPLAQRHMDIARSLQSVLEETVLHMTEWLQRQTGASELCMAGGVALNCVMNSRVARDGPFDRVWVQPAAGDAGTALGAALYLDDQLRGQGRRWVMEDACLGPSYEDEEIEETLERAGLKYRREEDIAAAAARLLAQDKVVAWFQGRMEFGPRALGSRSILASPLDPHMQMRLNDLKDREDFRPVAPAVLEERAHEWFDAMGRAELHSPFMLFVYDVLPECADRIPAVRHIDGTARVQTVRREQNPRYYEVLRAFEALCGVPVLVNTSFNTRGRPVVCTPRDALEAFYTSPLDALAIGSFLVEKQR